jgi:hypothetical protein
MTPSCGIFGSVPSRASFQHGVLESRLTWTSSESILVNLDAGNPCRHDGPVRGGPVEHSCFSYSAGERKLMKDFLVRVRCFFDR